MIDLVPYTRLHTVQVLSDLVHKWWKLELFLTDEQGVAIAPRAGGGGLPLLGRPFAADNDFCRLSLFAGEGARRCAESMRICLEKLRGAGRAERCVVHECHLGFLVVACSVWLGGALSGAVAVSGFTGEPLRSFAETQLLRRVHEIVPAASHGTDIERALRRIPIMARIEVEQLCDLLLLCADEIQFHHGERSSSLKTQGEQKLSKVSLVGESLPMQALRRQLERIGKPTGPVLIVGELGVGKTQVGRFLHGLGPLRNQQLILQDCAQYQEESILQNILSADSGGTLLLIEIDALSLPAQAKVLDLALARFEGILATARLPLTEVDPRLLALRLVVPPLRDRLDDLPLLLGHFVPELPMPLPEDIADALTSYSWPGNVREFQGELQRLAQLFHKSKAEGKTLQKKMLSPRLLMDG